MAISKFTTVYAGHIDFPDHGQDATPANERRFTNDQLAGVFEKSEAIAKTMDRLGYETLWLADQQFQRYRDASLTNKPMLATHLAHLTQNLRFGCGFNVAQLWPP